MQTSEQWLDNYGEMLKGFQNFVLRGNVLDLAVGVVIGAAFGTVVDKFVKDLMTPFLAVIAHEPDFSRLGFTIDKTLFPVGDFLNAVISFVVIAAVVYFLVVLPVNALLARVKRGETKVDPTTKKCSECLSEIPIAARKCAFCTSVVG